VEGTAHYYHIEVDGMKNENAAWYYPDPFDAAKQIRGVSPSGKACASNRNPLRFYFAANSFLNVTPSCITKRTFFSSLMSQGISAYRNDVRKTRRRNSSQFLSAMSSNSPAREVSAWIAPIGVNPDFVMFRIPTPSAPSTNSAHVCSKHRLDARLAAL